METEQAGDQGTRFLIFKDRQYKMAGGREAGMGSSGLVILDTRVRRTSAHCAAPRGPAASTAPTYKSQRNPRGEEPASWPAHGPGPGS